MKCLIELSDIVAKWLEVHEISRWSRYDLDGTSGQ